MQTCPHMQRKTKKKHQPTKRFSGGPKTLNTICCIALAILTVQGLCKHSDTNFRLLLRKQVVVVGADISMAQAQLLEPSVLRVKDRKHEETKIGRKRKPDLVV